MTPDLTASSIERLAYLVEELGEAQQKAAKILRHGYDSFDPTDVTHQGNRKDLEAELGDVLAAIELLVDSRDIGPVEASQIKTEYFHHQVWD